MSWVVAGIWVIAGFGLLLVLAESDEFEVTVASFLFCVLLAPLVLSVILVVAVPVGLVGSFVKRRRTSGAARAQPAPHQTTGRASELLAQNAAASAPITASVEMSSRATTAQSTAKNPPASAEATAPTKMTSDATHSASLAVAEIRPETSHRVGGAERADSTDDDQLDTPSPPIVDSGVAVPPPLRLPPLDIADDWRSRSGISVSIELREAEQPETGSYGRALAELERGDKMAALKQLREVAQQGSARESAAQVLACLLSCELGDVATFSALLPRCLENEPALGRSGMAACSATLRVADEENAPRIVARNVLDQPAYAGQMALVGSLLARGSLTETAKALERLLELIEFDPKWRLPPEPILDRTAADTGAPTTARRIVRLGDVLAVAEAPLTFALGMDYEGRRLACDIREMPHLLVLGAAGAGKSTVLHAAICSLLMRHTPDELMLLTIDTKRVELNRYEGIPHLLDSIDDASQAVYSLEGLCELMEARYAVASNLGARTLDEMNDAKRERGEEAYPRVVVVVDELADISPSRGDVKKSVARLVREGSSVGIHLILAAAWPSREQDVVAGLSQAEIPSRIALSVASEAESQAMLGSTGAESLLGNGDMLYSPVADYWPTTRVQGACVNSGEIDALAEFWRAQARAPEAKPDPVDVASALCWLYERLEDHEKTLDVVRRVSSPLLNIYKARALASKGLTDAAFVVLDDYIRIFKGLDLDRRARYAKAELLVETNDLVRARRELGRIYADDPHFADSAGLLEKVKIVSARSRSRAPIPEEVRHAVWRRDEGKCVQCGSLENLEFDHVIPISRGGSNTERNVQLLCARCNRAKAASI